MPIWLTPMSLGWKSVSGTMNRSLASGTICSSSLLFGSSAFLFLGACTVARSNSCTPPKRKHRCPGKTSTNSERRPSVFCGVRLSVRHSCEINYDTASRRVGRFEARFKDVVTSNRLWFPPFLLHNISESGCKSSHPFARTVIASTCHGGENKTNKAQSVSPRFQRGSNRGAGNPP